jgi:hypothetical protein
MIATVGESLDRDYLQRWATKLGVSDLLKRATAQLESS